MNLVDRIAVVVSASTQGATQEFARLEQSAKKTQSAADKMGAAFGVSGKTLAAGVAAGAAAIVGSGLLHFLDQSVDAYGASAKAAGDLATATGSSAETVSRMTAALQDAGVSAERTNTLLTKFTTNFGKNVDLIRQLGVEVVKNKDGTTDYAATMVAAVDAIDAMGDASTRNAALVKLFGKAGAAAFQDLFASGVKLSEAMRLVSKYRVFTADDVSRAAAYDDAVDSLGASFQGLQFTIGRNLVPALSDTVQLFADLLTAATPILDVLTAIPPQVYLFGGAMFLLSRHMGAITKAASALVTGLSDVLFSMGDLDAAMRGDFAGKGVGKFERLGKAIGGVNGSLIAVTAAVAFWQISLDHLNKTLDETLTNAGDADKSIEDLAQQALATSSVFDRIAARGTGGDLWQRFIPGYGTVKSFTDFVDAIRGGDRTAGDFEKRLKDLQEEQGSFAVVLAKTTAEQQTLNDTVAEFLGLVPKIDGAATSWQDVADAAVEANTALLGQKQAANAAATALGTYAVSIQQVIDWQKKLAGQPATVEEALNRIQTAFQELTTDAEGRQIWQRITDDVNTFGDESKIALGNATTAVYDYIAALAATGMAAPDIVVNLQKLKDKLPDDLDKAVDNAIAQIEGKPNEMLLTVVPTINFSDPRVKDVTDKYDLRDPTQFKKWLDEVMAVSATPVSTNVEVTTSTDPVNVAATNAVVDKLTADRTVDIYFQTHGYNEIKRIIDNLTRDRTVQIQLATGGAPAGGPVPGAPRSVSSQTTYGPTFNLSDVHIEASDPGTLAADIERQSRRRRLVGMPS